MYRKSARKAYNRTASNTSATDNNSSFTHKPVRQTVHSIHTYIHKVQATSTTAIHHEATRITATNQPSEMTPETMLSATARRKLSVKSSAEISLEARDFTT